MSGQVITLSLAGATGRMGRAVLSVIGDDQNFRLVEALASQRSAYLGSDAWALAGLSTAGKEVVPVTELHADHADVMIDFAVAEGFQERVKACADLGTAYVSGSTGLSEADLATLDEASKKVPVLLAPNFSLGVGVMAKLIAQAAKALPEYDVEVIEMHHRRKKDAPSGTANRLLEVAAKSLNLDPATDVKHGREGITGERSHSEIGMHTLRGGDVVGDHTVIFAGEGERVEITHRATSRETFARGAAHAAKWIAGKPAGKYSMDDVLGL